MNNEIIMWACLAQQRSLMLKLRGVVRGVVSAAVFGTMLSLCMEDAKF